MNTQQISYAKLFVWNPRTEKWQYTNSGGAPVTLKIGTIMGIIFATSFTAAQVSTATDGSQVPYGILANTVIVPAGATVPLTLVVSGDVVDSGLTFGSTDTLSTQISMNGGVIGTIHTLLTKGGIRPIPSAEGTFPDN